MLIYKLKAGLINDKVMKSVYVTELIVLSEKPMRLGIIAN